MKNTNRKHLDEWIQLWHAFGIFYYRFLRKHDISLNSFHILKLLMKSPEGLEPSVIAESLGILRQALAPLLNGLEKREFIDRRAQKNDHRRKHIVITPDGIEFADRVEAELSILEMEAFDSFPDEELDRMFESMGHFHLTLTELMERRGKMGK